MIRALLLVALAFGCSAFAQDSENLISGVVAVHDNHGKAVSASGAVVWLTAREKPEPPPPPPGAFKLLQKNKRFHPHLLVVPIHSTVEFPNADDFFHNVFSVYEGTRFDLGLYESGSSKTVRFSRPGPSYIFCNIHPEMSAVVMVMKSPYYAVTGENGHYSIEGVPDGEYMLNVWFERARTEELRDLARAIMVEGDVTVPKLSMSEARSLSEGHKNKYGQDYEDPRPEPY